MNLTKLKRASNFEVEKWLTESLDLTPSQKSKLKERELVRFAPFYFYRLRRKERVSFLWRFTIIIVPVYIAILYILLPVRMMITGEWGYGRSFYDGFHGKWMNKLKL